MDHTDSNRLFPVFLKLEQFRVLLVGAGPVGLEKLSALLANSPQTSIRVVATSFHEDFLALSNQYPNVEIIHRAFLIDDLDGIDILITALNDREMSRLITEEARKRKILVNAADKPELCDFYLGSIVQKGNLKIAISTNGKSPTMAKRLKEWLNSVLPAELDDTLINLSRVRESLRGELSEKIRELNKLTEGILLPKK
jgi:siroheme synthase-like protein